MMIAMIVGHYSILQKRHIACMTNIASCQAEFVPANTNAVMVGFRVYARRMHSKWRACMYACMCLCPAVACVHIGCLRKKWMSGRPHSAYLTCKVSATRICECIWVRQQ